MSPAADSAQRFTDGLAALGLSAEFREQGPARSLAEAAAGIGLPPERIAKSIVVRLGEGDYRFVLVPGGRRISWAKFRSVLGVNRATMPDADEALAATGYVRGTIVPIGASTPWPVVADAALLPGELALGSGMPGRSAIVDRDLLLAALSAHSADISEPEEPSER